MTVDDDRPLHSAPVLDRILQARSGGQAIVLLSDFDGTLTDIVENPHLATLAPRARAILQGLSELPGVHVGVVSGRAIDDLRPLVGLNHVLLAGTGGMELDLAGTVIPPPGAEAIRVMVTETVHWMRDCLAFEPAAWIEKKSYGLTIHFAKVKHASKRLVRTRLVEGIQKRRSKLRVIECALGLEILPDVGITKASAARQILQHVQADSSLLVYAGNDANDQDAMAFAIDLGGIAIGVGPHAPPHGLHLHQPDDYLDFLGNVLDSLESLR